MRIFCPYIVWNIILTFHTIRDFFVNFLTDNQRVWGVFFSSPWNPRQALTLTSAIDFIDLEFEEWKHRDEDPNLLMRDFHYTKPMSGIGPKEVYCQGECSAIIYRDEPTLLLNHMAPLFRARREPAS